MLTRYGVLALCSHTNDHRYATLRTGSSVPRNDFILMHGPFGRASEPLQTARESPGTVAPSNCTLCIHGWVVRFTSGAKQDTCTPNGRARKLTRKTYRWAGSDHAFVQMLCAETNIAKMAGFTGNPADTAAGSDACSCAAFLPYCYMEFQSRRDLSCPRYPLLVSFIPPQDSLTQPCWNPS